MKQIFDNQKVLELIREWKKTSDRDILSDIIVECKDLVTAIVRKYDYREREDIEQEAFIKIQRSLPFYDESKSTCHNFLTTVVHNSCIDYMRGMASKVISKETEFVEFGDGIEEYAFSVSDVGLSDVNTELRTRNRKRFPSLDTFVIDTLTDEVITNVKHESMTGLTKKLAKKMDLPSNIVECVVKSSIIYLRIYYTDKVDIVYPAREEFSLHHELSDFMGENYDNFVKIFHGVSIKV